MGLMNALSFLELTKVNKQLNDILQSNEINNQRQERLEVNKSITKLFQDLANHNNTIQLTDLSGVNRIQQFINNEFNNTQIASQHS